MVQAAGGGEISDPFLHAAEYLLVADGRIVSAEELLRNPEVKSQPIESIMQPAFPFVDISTPVDVLAAMITPQNPAVLVRDFKSDKTFIITRSDVIRVL